MSTVSRQQDLALIDERELKLLIKDWRSGRATRNLRQALSDGYIAVLGTLMVGAMIVNVVLRAHSVVAQCEAGGCLASRLVVPWAVFAGVLAGALVMSRLFGPVLASAAEGFWLLDAPVRRSRLLWPRLVAVLSGAFVVGGALGAATAALTGSPWPAVVAWTLACGLGAAAIVAFAAAEQGANRQLLTRLLNHLFAGLALAALLLVVAIATGWINLDLPIRLRMDIAVLLAAAGLLGVVLFGVLGLLRLNSIKRARLLSGGALVSGAEAGKRLEDPY